MTNRLAKLLGVPLLLAACDADGITGAEKEHLLRRLQAAEARWEQKGTSDYAYTLNRACFCGYTGLVQVFVRQDVVVYVRSVETGEVLPEEQWSSFPSVRELFGIIADAIDLPAGDLQVTFDSALGYPREISIDWYSNAIDDEIGYYASGLESVSWAWGS